MNRSFAAALAVCVSCLAPRLAAQVAKGDSAAAETAERFAVPESPAFTFLNVSPATIARPATVRDLSAAIIDGVDAQGRVRQGFAFEFTPFYLVPGYRISAAQYAKPGWNSAYVLANAQVSIGTVRSSGDSADTDIAIGLRLTLHDAGDPWRYGDFRRVVGDQFQGCKPADPEGWSEEDERTCLARVLDSLSGDFARRHWNATRIAVAVAHGSRLNESRPSDVSDIGDRVWGLGSFPLGPTGQGVAYVEWQRMRRQDDVEAFSALAYGGRLLLGGSTMNAFYELVGESRFSAGEGIRKRASSWSAGVELRAAQDLWISTGVGRRADAAPAADHVVVLANLRWGLSRKARFAP